MRLATVRGKTAVWALAVLLLAAGCDEGGGASGTGEPDGEILVSAAASLTDAFGDMEAAFEAANPGTDVVLNLAASSLLREQILEGAPVDVFASANTRNMQLVADAGRLAAPPVAFARNLLEIAVPRGNPAGITGLGDFSRDDLLLGLCAEGVPCGDFAREALDAAGVVPVADTDEPTVRALLTKIEAGELDAGITYVTDVAAAGGTVDGIAIPDEYNVVAEYPIVVVAEAPNPEGAEAFVTFVLSPEGRAVLQAHGFTLP